MNLECGGGAGVSVGFFGLMMGLLTLAGSPRLFRWNRKRGELTKI